MSGELQTNSAIGCRLQRAVDAHEHGKGVVGTGTLTATF